MRVLVLLVALLSACATVQGSGGGRTLRAEVTTDDGARIEVRRWSNGPESRRVLVVPPLGFDAALVSPLCGALRERGFDVVTFSWRKSHTGAARGLAAAARDVEAAYASGNADLVLLVGYGAVPASPVLRRHPPRGIVAINAPLRMRFGNPVLREAWAREGYAPNEWARGSEAALLLGAGRVTPNAVARRFEKLAIPVDARTSRELGTLLRTEARLGLPSVPTRLLVGAKDNLVHGEDALVVLDEATASTEPFSFPKPHLGNEKGGPATNAVKAPVPAGRDEAPLHPTLALQPTPAQHPTPTRSTTPTARRMAIADYFARDWGHLDWLVDPLAERDVWPVIAAELEALP